MDRAKEILMDTYLPEVKIPEFFLLDVDKILDEFESKVSTGGIDVSTVADGDLKIIQDPEYRRLQSTIDFNLAIKQFGHWSDRRDGLKKKLEELNRQKNQEVRLCFTKFFLVLVKILKHIMQILLLRVGLKYAEYLHQAITQKTILSTQ